MHERLAGRIAPEPGTGLRRMGLLAREIFGKYCGHPVQRRRAKALAGAKPQNAKGGVAEHRRLVEDGLEYRRRIP
jgi:hypothetical protein